MAKRGPKEKTINWDEFDKLVSYQCTQKEIAAFFDISVDTLENLCVKDLGVKLSDIWEKREFAGRVRLRKIQFEIAENMGSGSAAMAIFLGKTILGQTDQPRLPENDGPKKPQKKTFEEFCETAGYPKPYPQQVEMKDFVIADDEPRLLLGARGYGKTDYPEIMGVSYDIYCLYLDGLYTSYLIVTKSKARSSAIVSEMANALIANGIPLEKQNTSFVRVKGQQGKDHTIEAVSIKTSFRSRHPKRIIMDDPVTEEDTSEAMRVLVKKKYDEAYKLCKNIVIIGQPAHSDDLYAELRPRLKLMLMPHGKIPELDADLEAMKLAGVDPHSIEMSYHLRIPESGQSIFSNIKFIDKLPHGDTVAFIDPSDGGDYTAITIFRGYFDGLAVEGHVYKKAWYHCLDELVPLMIKKNVKRLGFETNFSGQQPIEQLRKLLKDHAISVVAIYSETNKHATIVAAGSYAHQIHLSTESHPTYTKHVTKYEYGSKFDDAPDSLARGLQWLGLIKSKK